VLNDNSAKKVIGKYKYVQSYNFTDKYNAWVHHDARQNTLWLIAYYRADDILKIKLFINLSRIKYFSFKQLFFWLLIWDGQ